MKKIIMTSAWNLAKSGQTAFGGKVSEYFSESLRITWRLLKMDMNQHIKNELSAIFKGQKIRTFSLTSTYYQSIVEAYKKSDLNDLVGALVAFESVVRVSGTRQGNKLPYETVTDFKWSDNFKRLQKLTEKVAEELRR